MQSATRRFAVSCGTALLISRAAVHAEEGEIGAVLRRQTQELLGETAVVAAELQESLDDHGQRLGTRFRFMATWTKTPGGWRLLGHHVEAVLKDPPALALAPAVGSSCATQRARWSPSPIAARARTSAGSESAKSLAESGLPA